jgi:hypothetical protein
LLLLEKNKNAYSSSGFVENLHEVRNDGTIIYPLLRSSLLKEDYDFEPVTNFAKKHINLVVLI